MVEYARLADTAQRLINENGRSVTLLKLSRADDDTNKPWRGSTTARSAPEASVTGKAVFVPLSGADDLGFIVDQSSGIKRGSEVALFAANDDGGNDLSLFDEIQDKGGSWKILNTQLLHPADQKILYFFEVER